MKRGLFYSIQRSVVVGHNGVNTKHFIVGLSLLKWAIFCLSLSFFIFLFLSLVTAECIFCDVLHCASVDQDWFDIWNIDLSFKRDLIEL